MKPEKVIIYADEVPGKLIIENRLRKNIAGDVEILKSFWELEHEFIDMGAVPPLLVYADLVATGDHRNLEIAARIFRSQKAVGCFAFGGGKD